MSTNDILSSLLEQVREESVISNIPTKSHRLLANNRLTDFFLNNFDGGAVLRRFHLYNKRVESDKDRIRMHGQYYNNIYLGKRIFGPARKQVFTYTIVGGMERRFEIVDNQVNHIQFTHECSDKFIDVSKPT